jgi:enoyl-CoA hydratase/carnithine racemase
VGINAKMSDLSVTLGDDHVADVTLQRPPDNFMDVDLARAIADAIMELDAEPDCRAIVLSSTGKHFCAGARLSPDASDLPPESGNPLYQQVGRMFDGSIPIVAVLQGAAIGAGLGLALVADFRVACPETRFGATFARLGFHQGFGITTTLPRVVGNQLALDMLYTGRRVCGEEALAIGLCDRLVSSDELAAAARELAIEIAGSAPLAVRAIRRTMRGNLASDVRAATDLEHSAQQVLRRTDDYLEGVAAAAERRPPKFVGR